MEKGKFFLIAVVVVIGAVGIFSSLSSDKKTTVSEPDSYHTTGEAVMVHETQSDSTESGKKVTETFTASSISLSDIYGSVKVLTHSQPYIKVVYDSIGAFACGVHNGILAIKGDDLESGTGTIIVTTTNGKTVISTNSSAKINTIVVGGEDGVTIDGKKIDSINFPQEHHEQSEIVVYVPTGTALTMNNVGGMVHVGDINGPVDLSVVSGTLTFGKVTTAKVQIHGSADVIISEVTADVVGTVTGSGDFSVKKGNIQSLIATVTGSGDVYFGGITENATLSVTGSGDIDVKHVINTPAKSVTGSGNISVAKIGK